MQHSRSLSASAGWRWFLSALEATRKQPIVLMGVVLFYMLSMSILSVIPWFGPVLAAVFMPYGTVFFAHATRDVLADRQPQFAQLAELMRNRDIRQAMIRVGLVFGCVLVTVNALYGILAADEISRWVIDANDRLDWASVRANIPWDATIAMLVVYIPGLMAVWFAPLLVSDKGMPCGKALFYSFFGCVRNIVPVIVLGVVLTAISSIVAVGLTALTVFLNISDLAPFIITPFVFVISTVIYASYWPMYEGLFEDVR